MESHGIARALSLVAALLALAGPAGAAVTLQTDGRLISFRVQYCDFTTPPPNPPCNVSQEFRTPAPPFAPFNQTLDHGPSSNVTQNSTLTATGMSGTGEARGIATTSYPGFDDTEVRSVVDVTFLAPGAHNYSLTGSLFRGPGGGVSAELTDVSAGTTLYTRSTLGPLNKSGSLIAGHQYRLRIEALAAPQPGSGAADSATFSFSFTLAAVAPVSTLPYEEDR